MIMTSAMLQNELGEKYSNPKTKIARMVKAGDIFPVVRGIYETDKSTSLLSLANVVYGPSYISFETALSFYGMIPERVYACTSASFDKKKHKEYHTVFGTLYYRDIPKAAYPYEINVVKIDYPVCIASLEKAVCDYLYIAPCCKCVNDMRDYLFYDMRFDEDIFAELRFDVITELAPLYKSSNLDLFVRLIH